MDVQIALFLIFIAGLINGSFALPTKYLKIWKFENIWLNFAVWTFVILPWAVALFAVPQIFSVYADASARIIAIMLTGGFIFGIGQVCFALALNMIGFGLSFVLNLGLGIILGFLLPLIVQHPEKIMTPFGLTTIIGSLLAVIGLLLSNRAGSLHHHEQAKNISQGHLSKHYIAGVILAVVAGVASAGQNFSFALTANMQNVAQEMGASAFGAANIMWPGFLTCGFIPYALFMIYLTTKHKTFSNFSVPGSSKYYLFALIMGLCWYGSLVFYSKATQMIGSVGPVVGWPLFMVMIILTSNFWGWRYKEWQGCSSKVKHTLWLGLAFMVFAIIVLGYSSVYHT
jgi:L-rhamnose-H+ transport protein